MHTRPAFIHRKQAPVNLVDELADVSTTEWLTLVMPIEVLEADMTIPEGRQYIVYGSLEIPDGLTLEAIGSLVIL